MLALRAALWSLSLVAATSAAEPLTLSWRRQLVLDPEWQQYFSRSEYLRQLDQQQLQQELTQQCQHAPTLPAKDLKFGFPLQPNPASWLSAEASRIAKVILSFQTPSGGWSKRTDMASRPRQPGQLYGTEVDYIPTFDNDATSTQILWLTAFLPYASEASSRFLLIVIAQWLAAWCSFRLNDKRGMAGINLMLKLYSKLIRTGKQGLVSGIKKKRLCY